MFTVSVGNLPAGARAIIKITYVTEMKILSDDGGATSSINFNLPASVSAHIRNESLVNAPITQSKTDQVTSDLTNMRLVTNTD